MRDNRSRGVEICYFKLMRQRDSDLFRVGHFVFPATMHALGHSPTGCPFKSVMALQP